MYDDSISAGAFKVIHRRWILQTTATCMFLKYCEYDCFASYVAIISGATPIEEQSGFRIQGVPVLTLFFVMTQII